MTDYGRSPGSEPWHPGDPLYGDSGWAAQQGTDGSGVSYGGQQQYPQQPQAPVQAQAPMQAQAPYGAPAQPQPQDPYQQQYQPQHQYQQQPQQPQYQGGGAPYGAQQYHDPQYGEPQYNDPRYGGPQQHPGPQRQPSYNEPQYPEPQYNEPQYNGGWDDGQQGGMPYGANPSTPYQGQRADYPDSQDYYATADAYPPPQPPGQRHAEPEPADGQEKAGEEADEEGKETHPFFTGKDDDGDADEGRAGEGRGGAGRERRGGKTKKKKSRNGTACLVVAAVFLGGAGGIGYVGYQFWESKFGPPPDYTGAGSGDVQVEIPQGAGGYEIGAILVKNGVVKSQRAFVAAQKQNPKGNTIQAGVYILSKEMSARNAVTRMLSPNSRNALIIPEGKRNEFVYAQIDKRLGIKKGETAAVAKAQAKNLGLPKWADDNPSIKDPLEGFLFPASYPVAKGTKPEVILKKMVARAKAEYEKQDLEGEAKKLGLKSPLQLITVASLVQVEGKYKHDFDKVARVVYNRLEPDNTETVGRLEFDSTVNYIKSQSRLDLGAVDDLRKIKDPYNTYDIKGLPPGPISNPGAEALHSAINPAEGPWYYFVSVTSDKTLFAVTNQEHEENRRQYENESKKP
ncbi:endolytic transglycosylase MltG [Streptomyces sp. NPDC093085]|uniref:endolytic transglycosylase MltG n=1 Tax=Streptomyces sp. NPDC093085 TaxID=3155068 RepID=UPI003417E89A